MYSFLSILFAIGFNIVKFCNNASLILLCFSRLDYRKLGIHHIYSLKMLIVMIMTNIPTNIRIIMLMLLIFDGNGNFQNHIIFFRGFVWIRKFLCCPSKKGCWKCSVNFIEREFQLLPPLGFWNDLQWMRFYEVRLFIFYINTKWMKTDL